MADQEVSFLPSQYQEGGGGVVQAASGVTLTFETVSYDYNGSVAVAVPAIHIHGSYEDGGETLEFDEYYSAGDASRLRAKKDGTGFQALAEVAGLTKTTKAAQFLASLVSANSGDESILTSNIKDLDGINVDMSRKPDIERAGLETKAGGRGRTILVITAINSMPGESAPKKGVKGKAPAPAAKGKPAAGGKAKELRTKTIAAVEAAIEAAGGSVESENIGQLVFRAHKKDPDVRAMVEMISADDYTLLSADDTPWGFDGVTLTSE